MLTLGHFRFQVSCLETPTAAWPRKVSGEDPSPFLNPQAPFSLSPCGPVGKCFSLSLVPEDGCWVPPDVVVWGCRQCLC